MGKVPQECTKKREKKKIEIIINNGWNNFAKLSTNCTRTTPLLVDAKRCLRSISKAAALSFRYSHIFEKLVISLGMNLEQAQVSEYN